MCPANSRLKWGHHRTWGSSPYLGVITVLGRPWSADPGSRAQVPRNESQGPGPSSWELGTSSENPGLGSQISNPGSQIPGPGSPTPRTQVLLSTTLYYFCITLGGHHRNWAQGSSPYLGVTTSRTEAPGPRTQAPGNGSQDRGPSSWDPVPESWSWVLDSGLVTTLYHDVLRCLLIA